jgi:hypothetical protein
MEESGFYAVKGVVDAKGDQGAVLVGFVGVSEGASALILETSALPASVDPGLPFPQFREQLRKGREAQMEPFARFAEQQLQAHIQDSRGIPGAVKADSGKGLEGGLIQFFQKKLGLRAVAVVKMEPLSVEAHRALEEELAAARWAGAEEAGPEAADASAPEASAPRPGAERTGPNQILLPCQPLLDPVGGVGASELRVGDSVRVRLSEESLFFGMFKNKMPELDGGVAATVSGVRTTETGSVRIDLDLSEGIVGVMTVNPAVRLRADRASGEDVASRGVPSKDSLLVIGVLALAVAILAGLLLYLR